MRQCALVQLDQPTRDFVATARVALGIASNLDEENPIRAQLLNALEDAFKILDTREPFEDAFYASLAPAYALLKDGIAGSGPALDVDIHAVGHAHIDVAWLWTYDHTRGKARRTFTNVLRLMEEFPDYIFGQSQPQLYEFIRQDSPELFAAIHQRVQEGRWEAMGGMWVEADCNLSGAESLVRQLLLGRSYFCEHFGKDVDTPVLWLPDVFGYAWNLPQLIKEAGLKYFFTIKIGWNQYNRLPFDSFWWQGLDGTRVLTHFSTTPEEGSNFASTYNAAATPKQVLGTWRNFQQKDLSTSGGKTPLLMAYGYGDGGGGPTREMLENVREMEDFPGSPQVHSRRVGSFFEQLEQSCGSRLPVWNGELYLEYHRGTYTTQGRNKRANRKAEFGLHDAEFLATVASQWVPGYQYPQEVFKSAWQTVCLNQFHDVLPGSSIGLVYLDSQEQYAALKVTMDGVTSATLAILADHISGEVLVANPTSFARRDLVFLPEAEIGDLHTTTGQAVMQQPVQGGILLDVSGLPPYSLTALLTGPGQSRPSGGLKGEEYLLENDFLRVEFNPQGDICSIYDKTARREVLPKGMFANQMLAFEDRPRDFDAWDIDIDYDDKLFLAEPADSMQVVESGPLRATLEVRRRILNSSYVQRISLTHNSPRLDFSTRMEWRERHILLKVAFPVDVLSPMATYEIQWGNVERPTHRNTSWDWARFETCAHKWVDLSEGGYGASLLNDCKYGHDIQGQVMRLSLLRAPTFPDWDADQGDHEFAYALLPHLGGWNEDTLREAYSFNDALIGMVARKTGTGTTAMGSLVAVDAPNVIIETVKQAEDGQGVIVRLYECQRMRSLVSLRTGFPLRRVTRVNLLEEVQEQLPCTTEQVSFEVSPYQIVTLRLE